MGVALHEYSHLIGYDEPQAEALQWDFLEEVDKLVNANNYPNQVMYSFIQVTANSLIRSFQRSVGKRDPSFICERKEKARAYFNLVNTVGSIYGSSWDGEIYYNFDRESSLMNYSDFTLLNTLYARFNNVYERFCRPEKYQQIFSGEKEAPVKTVVKEAKRNEYFSYFGFSTANLNYLETIKDVERELESILLDFHNLYDKINRLNSSNFSKAYTVTGKKADLLFEAIDAEPIFGHLIGKSFHHLNCSLTSCSGTAIAYDADESWQVKFSNAKVLASVLSRAFSDVFIGDIDRLRCININGRNRKCEMYLK